MPVRYLQASKDATDTANLIAQLGPKNAGVVFQRDTNRLVICDPDTGVLTDVGAVPSALNDGNVAQIVETDLTAAQIITLHSVPVTVIPAPAAGIANIFLGLVFSMTYGTTQFTGGGVVQAQYHTKTTNLMDSTVLDTSIKAAASFAAQFVPATTASGIVLFSALAIELIAATQDFAAGDSTAKVYAFYRQVTL